MILRALLCLVLLASCSANDSGVQVVVGPTAIPRGDASGENDITISNGRFAVAFAVDSAPPWGVARGGIVDIGILRDGKPDFDIASLVDFMPNNWSSWPTSYQRVELERQTADEVVVRTERDWGEVTLTTRFRIRAGDTRLQIETHMRNDGEEPLDDLLTGYVVWPDGGHLIATPANIGGAPGHGWTAAYDTDWALGLHAPFAEVADRLGRDRYTGHSLAPGESRSFTAWLQIENEGSLEGMIASEIEFGSLPSGRLQGKVLSDDGAVIEQPAVIIEQDGEAKAWALGENGEFDLRLPVGEYDVYAVAEAHGAGETQRVRITNGGTSEVEFTGVGKPGELQLEVESDGQPRDARVRIVSGQKPVIAYHGKDVFFTDLANVGQLVTVIAPGDYEFEVAAGAGFTSLPVTVSATVESGAVTTVPVDIEIDAEPAAAGWYSADLHHHSDVLDGFTEAEFVLRSQLAAGVDVAFLSDHDSVINNREMAELAASRSVPFIPATELSPSWGHFNAYPIDAGKTVDIDTGQADVAQVFTEARRLGADVIAVNHPYSDYGYFTSSEKDTVPGGFDDGFDLLEIGPEFEDSGNPVRNEATLQRAWRFWNEGKRAYVLGGSDVHDVWSFVSARARTYVYVDADLDDTTFVAAVLAGRSYASQGPLVFPEIVFGSTVTHNAGSDLKLRYAVQAVAGLKRVVLIADGRQMAEKIFAGELGQQPVEFIVRPDADIWYSLVVEDNNGKFAYTNPVWVEISDTTGE